MVNEDGQTLTVRGESLGGGKIRISRINQVDVDFTGEYSTAIVIHQDTPGVVAHITRCLAEENINIAFMKLFREEKGQTAYSIVESDDELPGFCQRKNLPESFCAKCNAGSSVTHFPNTFHIQKENPDHEY